LSGTDELPSVAAYRGLEPRRLTGLVRGELDWVILKSLEKDRNRRYETANGFAMDLQRYLSDEPVSAGSPGARYRVKKFVRRNRLQVIAGGLVLLALLAGTVGTTFGLFRALAAEGRALTERDEKDVARQRAVDEAEARARAERDTRVALDVMTDEVVDDLLGRQVRLTDQHREFLKKVVAYHARFAAANADDSEGRIGKAAGSFRVGRIRFFLGELKEAEAAYRDALALQQQLVAELPNRLDVRHELTRTYRYLGVVLSGTGRHGPAEAAYGEAVTVCKELTARSTRADFRNTLAECILFLGNEFGLTFRREQAEAHFRDALAVYKQLADDFPDVPEYQEGVATCYYELAGVLIGVHRSKEAEEACRKAIELSQMLSIKYRTRPEFHEEVVRHYVKLGALFQETDRPAEAEAAWREAVRLGKELVADFPVRPEFIHQLILSQNNLGMLLLKTNRLSEAEELWRETLTLSRYLAAQVSARADFRFELVVAYHNVATVFELMKRLKPAEEAYREAVRLGKKLAQDYPHNAVYWHQWVLSNGNLAGFLRVNDRPKEAEVAYREIMPVVKQLTREKHMAQLHYQLGVVLSKQEGRLDEAVAEYREALRLNSDTPEAHYKPCEVRNELGNALLVKNQLDEAIVEYNKAIELDPKYANAHNNRGLALQAKNQWDEAIKEFKKAIELDPNYAGAHNVAVHSLLLLLNDHRHFICASRHFCSNHTPRAPRLYPIGLQ
jgi:tetratricopeptide (TPR) repeat protein